MQQRGPERIFQDGGGVVCVTWSNNVLCWDAPRPFF